MNYSESKKTLTLLIDSLTPLNNKFRTVSDPIKKITLMWAFGKILDDFMTNNNIKLHELLYKIYDPHSTSKMSYITRDLGSYSYRIYKYFKNEAEINDTLSGLQKYSIFREAIPLLFNERYNMTPENKNEILRLIRSGLDSNIIINNLRKKKKEILPIKNPRNQKANIYDNNKEHINNYYYALKKLYTENEILPSESNIEPVLGDSKNREYFVMILMALAGDSFLNKLEKVDSSGLDSDWSSLYSIAISKNLNRARFRKWVINSNNLLNIAEAIQGLSNDSFYRSFRPTFLKSKA